MSSQTAHWRDGLRNFSYSRSLLLGLALQAPIFAALGFLYSHRPLTDPTSVNYDVRLYFNAATAVIQGQLPYRDFFFQYPPLALLFFVPPRLFASDLSSFFVVFNIELFVLSCVGLAATAFVASRLGQSLLPTMLVYSLGLIAFGAIVPQRYDLAPAILSVLAIAARLSGRHGWAYLLLAIGTLTKIFPALVFPLFLIQDWRREGFRGITLGTSIFGGTIAAVMLPLLLLSGAETLDTFIGQAGRDVGIASLYASVMLAARSVGVPAKIVYQPDFNTWNVQLPSSEIVVAAATLAQLVIIAFVYLRFARSRDQSHSALVRYSAAAIGVGILASKVLSAQYIIWVFPIAFLTGAKRFSTASMLFLMTAVLTQILYPFLWNDLKQGTLLPILVALGRDTCLAALCILLLRTTTEPPPVLNSIPQTNAVN